MIGANFIPVPFIDTDQGFRLDLDRLASLVTPEYFHDNPELPAQPDRHTPPTEDLARIAEIAIEHDLWVLSDEIYSRLVYDGDFVSISSLPDMAERTILVDGFQKPMP